MALRSPSVCCHGLRAAAAIQLREDELDVEAIVPEVVGKFACMIETIGRHYARRRMPEKG